MGLLSLWVAPAALAHHPVVSGTTQCLDNGTQRVTWTVKNSQTNDNRTMTITALSVSRGDPVSGLSIGQTFAAAANGSPRTGTQIFAGNAGGSVTLTVTASWNNGGPASETRSATVTLKTDCKTPADPKASIEQNCDDGAKITLKNDGDTATTFTVYKTPAGGAETVIDASVSVAGHATVVKKYAMAEDETSSYRVTSGTYNSGKVSLTNNCTNPGASIDDSCADDGAKIVLTNLNAQKSTTFDIFKNGNKIDTVTVSAGATVTKTYGMDEDETATFRAKTGDGYDSGNVSVTLDCTNPKAVIVQDCDEAGAKLTLTNTGSSGTSFEIFKNGTKIDTVAVAAGATVVKTYAMNEDEEATFRAKADNYDSENVKLVNNCTNPDAVIAQDCDPGGAELTLTNLGAKKSTSFDIFKNGNKIDTVAVAAGATVTKSYAMAEDESATFRAKAGAYDSGDVQLTNNCTNPGANVVQSCDAGGAVVTMTNSPAQKSTTFKVFKDNVQVGADVVVAAGATATRNVAIAEDATATIKVTSGTFTFTKDVKNDCTNPKALVEESCDAGGAKVTLTNPNATKSVTFKVFKDNVQVGEDVIVAPNATQTRNVAIDEDDTAVIKVTGTDFADFSKSVDRDCTNPAALITQDCAEGGAVFNLSNTGELATTFQILENGTQVGDNIAVAAGGTAKQVVAMAEDEESTFVVKTLDGFESDPEVLVHNCTNPGAAIAQDCADGGAVIALSNTGGELPISFDVFKGAAKIDTVAVAADASVTKIYAMAEDETAVFRATSGAFDSGAISLTNDCTEPGAAIIQSCVAGGAFFALTNAGESAESFTVSKNGAVVETVSVPGDSALTKTYPMAEDETSTFRATSASGFDSGVVSLTHDCTPTEVLGVQFEQPRQLPRTGSSPFPLTLQAIALLGLGVVFLRVRVLLFGRGA